MSDSYLLQLQCVIIEQQQSSDDDSPAMETGSLTQQGDGDLVKQIPLKIIPEIPRSGVIFLHILAM